MGNPFTKKEREDLLSKFFDLTNKSEEIMNKIDNVNSVEPTEALTKNLSAINKELGELWTSYKDGVPFKNLSKCPFTGELLTHSLDINGLNGLWWNTDLPTRPEENLPKTYFAMSGAMKLNTPIESFPFLCATGPEVPFVLPRLLQYTQMKAVISSTTVGKHIVYFIFYYADPMIYNIERVNDYASNSYSYVNTNNEIKTWTSYENIKDFDLKSWIENGKLLWIFPEDEDLILHSDVSRCPYLNLEGSKNNKYIQNEKIWSGKNIDIKEYFANEDTSGENTTNTKNNSEEIDQDILKKAIKYMSEGGL